MGGGGGKQGEFETLSLGGDGVGRKKKKGEGAAKDDPLFPALGRRNSNFTAHGGKFCKTLINGSGCALNSFGCSEMSLGTVRTFGPQPLGGLKRGTR